MQMLFRAYNPAALSAVAADDRSARGDLHRVRAFGGPVSLGARDGTDERAQADSI